MFFQQGLVRLHFVVGDPLQATEWKTQLYIELVSSLNVFLNK